MFHKAASALIAVMACAACAAVSLPAQAQNQSGVQTSPLPPFSTQTQAPAQPKKDTKPATKPQPAAAKSSDAPAGAQPSKADGSGQLRQRIEQLEEQLVDMQTTVGTLDSLAKNGAVRAASSSPGASAALSGDASVRVDQVETQMRALSNQIDQLAQKMRSLEARLSSGGGSPNGGRPQDRGDVVPNGGPATQTGRAENGSTGFGTTEVKPNAVAALPDAATPATGDAIGGLLKGGAEASAPASASGRAATGGTQQAVFSQGGGNPKEVYERAYAQLLQQDYPAAEGGFSEFLGQFPNHDLSGNAQYWLGETHYVRGQYRQAANAYLKGYQSYGRSQKAPDSLLKLGMSLDRLGQKEAACSSLGELGTRFPSAPAYVQSRAQTERARIGCP